MYWDIQALSRTFEGILPKKKYPAAQLRALA